MQHAKIEELVPYIETLTQLELEEQFEKWGEQNHEPFVWLAIVLEEFGEASQAILDASSQGTTLANNSWGLAQKEVIQTIACLYHLYCSLL